MTTVPIPRRDWFKIGATYNGTAQKKGQMSANIAKLEWQALPLENVPMAPGMAIEKLIQEFKIPKVSQVAWNVVVMNRYGLIGIEGNYKNGRARIYALDRGADLIPVAADFWTKEEAANDVP